MIAETPNTKWVETSSPHSLGLRDDMQVPSSMDSNPLMIEQKKFWGAGMRGLMDGEGVDFKDIVILAVIAYFGYQLLAKK